MPKYVKAEPGAGHSVIYTDANGKQKIKDFSAAEFEKFWRAIEKMEGWRKEGFDF